MADPEGYPETIDEIVEMVRKLRHLVLGSVAFDSANGPLSGPHSIIALDALETARQHFELAAVYRARKD